MSMNPRLVMNHLQYEFGLIPSKIVKENKGLWTIFHFGKEYADTTQNRTIIWNKQTESEKWNSCSTLQRKQWKNR